MEAVSMTGQQVMLRGERVATASVGTLLGAMFGGVLAAALSPTSLDVVSGALGVGSWMAFLATPVLAIWAIVTCGHEPGHRGRGMAMTVLVLWILGAALVLFVLMMASGFGSGMEGGNLL